MAIRRGTARVIFPNAPRVRLSHRAQRKLVFDVELSGVFEVRADGRVLVTDGPYTETKEHMGSFWILEAADLDEALAWAKKAAIACDVPGEVRELHFYPAPEKVVE